MSHRYLLTHSIEEWAERAPASEAVRCSGKGLSYQALHERAGKLSQALLAHGVRRGDRVGIYMNKSLESATAIYGILGAGAAYVPLDPFAPPARLAYVLQDCGIRHLVSRPEKAETVAEVLAEATQVECLLGTGAPEEWTGRVVSWDEIDSAPAQRLPDTGTIEQDLAYILYTSGSTGAPKGIMHTHRSGLSFAEWAAAEYGLRSEDRLSNHAPLHFDLSTFDFFAGHLAGATTVIIPESVTKFPASLSKLMAEERISVWYSVPYALMQLLAHGNLSGRDLSALRWVLFAGEPFPTKHLRQVMSCLPQARFSNLYGPTETNVCTYYHVASLPEDHDDPIPIGRPCTNVEALILDEAGQPVGEGGIGELLIRGPITMRGYWGQEEKTRQGFFGKDVLPGMEEKYYRTGDLVQQAPDGNLNFLGRKDRQVKTRGFRVELDEIEVALLAHPGVEEAAVYAVADGQGSNSIEGAVTAKPGMAVTPAELTAHLSERLPPYAIPTSLTITLDFPRTSTGKIDRRALQSLAAAGMPIP
jgi:amino acid adenylation domain-containing protein